MAELRKLAKEEIVKSLIDKLIFGLVAAFIVFGVQKCSDQSTRIQIEKEAILQLGSSLILNEARILQSLFSEYISIVMDSIVTDSDSSRYYLTEENAKIVLSLENKIKSSLDIIHSVYGGDHEMEPFINFIEAIKSFNKMLIQSKPKLDDAEFKSQFKRIKKLYGDVLFTIQETAIESLSKQDN